MDVYTRVRCDIIVATNDGITRLQIQAMLPEVMEGYRGNISSDPFTREAGITANRKLLGVAMTVTFSEEAPLNRIKGCTLATAGVVFRLRGLPRRSNTLYSIPNDHFRLAPWLMPARACLSTEDRLSLATLLRDTPCASDIEKLLTCQDCRVTHVPRVHLVFSEHTRCKLCCGHVPGTDVYTHGRICGPMWFDITPAHRT